MPRIVLTIIQFALLAGIALLSFSIVHKQTTADDVRPTARPLANIPYPDYTPEDQPKPFSDYQAIASRNLFQTPKDETTVQATIDIEALKPTELKLKLWGTITGEDGMTRAVIEDQTKRQQTLFRAGEEVSSAIIKMILREKVILSVNGEDQILEIEKPNSTGRPTPATGGIRTADLPVGLPLTTLQAPAQQAIRVRLSQLGPISDNPENWNEYATVDSYKSDDGTSGLMFNRISPSSPLRRLGVRNGDVLLSVNNEPVSALGDIVELLQKASAGQEFSLNIKRRGRQRQLDYIFE